MLNGHVNPIFRNILNSIMPPKAEPQEIRQCPPCMGDCDQGRRCPARHVDDSHDVASTGIGQWAVSHE